MQERARLGALTAFVLIAHLWLLQSRNGDIYLANAVTTSAFRTRQIAAAPPPKPARVDAKAKPTDTRAQRKPLPSLSRAESTHNTTQQAVFEPDIPDSATETSPLITAPQHAESNHQVPALGETASTASNPRLSLRVPGSRRLKYAATGEARKMRYGADAELLWLHDGASYAARLEVGAFMLGKRVQTSAGSLGDEGLEPKRFSDKARTEVAAHFERTKGLVVFSTNTPEATLLPGAQDRLSVLLQLSALLAGAPERYPTGTRFAIQTIGPRDAETWQFVVEGDETLDLKKGPLLARKLQRLPVREFDLKVEVWLSPAMDWLPAQVKLTQANGDFVQLALESADMP